MSRTHPGSAADTASSMGTMPAMARRVQAGSTSPGSIGWCPPRRVPYAPGSAIAPEDGAATGEIGESMEPWAFSWWFTEASSHT